MLCFRGRTYGLCGNYNGDSSDDLQTRGGVILPEPSAVYVNEFGNSWVEVNTGGLDVYVYIKIQTLKAGDLWRIRRVCIHSHTNIKSGGPLTD